MGAPVAHGAGLQESRSVKFQISGPRVDPGTGPDVLISVYVLVGFALSVQTVLRISTCLVGIPSVTMFWTTRTTEGPESSRSTARNTSRSTG